MSDKIVNNDLIGAVWPTNLPGNNSESDLYGSVVLQTNGSVEARSLQTFRLVYTAGPYGMDDTGSIRVVFRFAADAGRLQTSDPAAYDFVSAHTSSGARINLFYQDFGSQRPWIKSLTARLHHGYISEGDTITIVFGDTSQGSPGMRMQTFCDSGFEFRVLSDVCAVGHYLPLRNQPVIDIVPGRPHCWRAILPSLRRPGETFHLGIKAEDKWGNPTDQADGRFRLETNLPVNNLPAEIEFRKGDKATTIENLSVDAPGLLTIRLLEDDACLAEAGPLVIQDGRLSGFWGDLHGQSAESLGTGTARQYFDFARNKSFLDLTAHQANDFQVTTAFWQQLNELTTEFQEDHRFVTFPGFEWSGNTCVGGDRNVYFRHEGRQIHRSSHALLADRSDIETDAQSASDLFRALADEDCIVYAHVGGRYADIGYAHDPRIETAMEVHSAWGTFEWLLTDSFALGYRPGVVCNSDGHKGRPGASYPGTSKFGAYGGLTCFLTEELTRDAIFECLRRRHHYGTTGCRMFLDVRALFAGSARLYERDPNAYPDAASREVDEAMMGDIVRTNDETFTLQLEIVAHAPIERVEVRNGDQTVETLRPYSEADLGSRIRVVWSGAEYRGRGRETTWTGRARFNGPFIKRLEKINLWNPERKIQQNGSDTVEWHTLTTGNFGGFDAYLDQADTGELDLQCNHGSLTVPLNEINIDDIVLDAGGLNRKVRVFRLPEHNPHHQIKQTIQIPLKPEGDNPIWVCVTTEDGFQAWSSPIYIFQ